MIDNRELFDSLNKKGFINNKRLSAGKIIETSSHGKVPFSKIKGMLLGVAVGDSLGATSEAMLPGERYRRYSEIKDYLPNRHTGLRKGYPTDDTQLTFFALEQILEDNGLIPDNIAKKFSSHRIFGIGKTVREFIHNYKDYGKSWYESGPRSAGNGALMRCTAVIPFHTHDDPDLLLADTVLNTMITHNDNLAIISAIAFNFMIRELLYMTEAPEQEWYISRFLHYAELIDDGSLYTTRGGSFPDYRGKSTDFIRMTLELAIEKKLPVADACNIWYSGAFLLETIPSVLYILYKHGNSFEEAVIRAVNDTKDNDTIAAITGSVLGALYGAEAIPERWVKDLTGMVELNSEGKIFRIIEKLAEALPQ